LELPLTSAKVINNNTIERAYTLVVWGNHYIYILDSFQDYIATCLKILKKNLKGVYA